jgi:hypothetical protein
MPVYVYEHIDEHGDCPVEFERVEKITSRGIRKCPICKNRVRRIIQNVTIAVNRLTPSKLNELGFKKLVRKDKGVYEAENKLPEESGHKVFIDKSKQK